MGAPPANHACEVYSALNLQFSHREVKTLIPTIMRCWKTKCRYVHGVTYLHWTTGGFNNCLRMLHWRLAIKIRHPTCHNHLSAASKILPTFCVSSGGDKVLIVSGWYKKNRKKKTRHLLSFQISCPILLYVSVSLYQLEF